MRGPKPRPKPAGKEMPPPPPPKELDKVAKAEWERITAILSRQRVLTESDTAALMIYCTSYSQYREAQKAIQEHGTVVVSATGTPVRNPYLTVQNSAWDRIRPLLAEFGLTPTARARLQLDEEPDDDGAEFF